MRNEKRKEIDEINKKRIIEFYDSLPDNKKDKLMRLLSSISHVLVDKRF